MEIGGYGFEKSELLKIAEQIYECKGKKEQLELKLSSESFHKGYISIRRNLVIHEVLFRLLFIVPLTIAVIGFLFGETNLNAFSSIFAVFVVFVGGYADIRLLIREIKNIILLLASLNSDKARAFAQKHNIRTFQDDERQSKKAISMLEEEIQVLDDKIAELKAKQQQLLEEKKTREDILRKKGVLFDENPNAPKNTGKFTLKEDSMGSMVDIGELHEYYLKEEQYLNSHILQLDGELQYIDKEILAVDEDFEATKKRLLFSFIIFVIVILVQEASQGIIRSLTSLLCFLVGLVYIFYLEKKCKQPILLYLIEHESDFTREYAFCNNMTPIKNKRIDILERIEQCRKELTEVKEKKNALEFS